MRVSRMLLMLELVLVAAACGGAPKATDAPVSTPPPTAVRYDRLVVHVMRETSDGQTREIGTIQRGVDDYRDQPISILVRRSRDAGEAREGAPAEYETRLDAGTERTVLPSFALDCSNPATCIKKDWLDLSLEGPSGSRHVSRTLFEATDDTPEPPAFRRHTIVVVAGAISASDVKARAERSFGGQTIDDAKAAMDAWQAQAVKASESQQADLLARLDGLDRTGAIGQLIALEDAAESDAATDRLAQTMGVTVSRPVPRILITTMQLPKPDDAISTSLDLRLDEVEADGGGPSASSLFQNARGVQESEIEGTILKALAGSDRALSTAILMSAARAQGTPILAVFKANQSDLDALSLSGPFAEAVHAAVDKGHSVLLPNAAVDVAGGSHWGFWDIDPKTGVTIGVMDDGEYQGLAEHPILTQSVAQNKHLGYCLGFMEGTISFQWGLMGGILEFGGVTPELLDQLENEMKSIACYNPCNQSAEVKVEVSVTECKADLAKMDTSPIPDEVSYCREYKKGFECAVGVLLAAYQHPGERPALEGTAEGRIQVRCASVGADSGGTRAR